MPISLSETELDYDHQKVNLPVSSRVAELLKEIRKFQEITEILGFEGEYSTGELEVKF